MPRSLHGSGRFLDKVATTEDDLQLASWVDLDTLHHLPHDGIVIFYAFALSFGDDGLDLLEPVLLVRIVTRTIFYGGDMLIKLAFHKRESTSVGIRFSQSSGIFCKNKIF